MAFINKVGFLTTIDHPIYYRKAVWVKTRKKNEYYHSLDKVLCIYNNNNFCIKTIKCDREFACIMDDVKDDLGVTMNYTNAQDHVPAAERNNRTMKESF